MSQDPELRAHQEWLGYLQPVGLVVSPAALRDSQAHVNKNIISEQETLISLTRATGVEFGKRGEEPPKRIRDFAALAEKLLAWEQSDLVGGPGSPALPASLEAPLADYGEILKPTHAVPDPANAGTWLMLIEVLSGGMSLDEVAEGGVHDRRWQASPQARFERLLRENQVEIGLLTNGEVLRLVYAPRGESTGYLDFPVAAMCEVPGRPILAAFHMLLSAERLFIVPTDQRLPALLQKSRKYQNEVSTKLAEQVLRALNELMRGFQSANEATRGELLRQVLHEASEEIYGGLLTTLMRLVFILYAEDRGLLPTEPFYVESYSISGLFERLREDAAQFPDTMDQRFGAWAQILTLSRLLHDGGGHGTLNLPSRRGRLFDPDAYPFLEGRPFRSRHLVAKAPYPPRVSDGVVLRVLQDLLLLEGDRLSYRSLDVVQIGSVYEAMMGFVVQIAAGPSIGLKPDHVVVNLAELLDEAAADRPKWLKEQASAELTGRALEELKTAGSVDDLVAAFGRKVSSLYLDGGGLPLVISAGGIYLQPTEERRRSGSHYTPRSLTEPIVRTTLEPILKQLGEKPRPDQILELRVCDPAMGSGAFLVESCRYLAEALVESWSVHAQLPIIPPDQEPILHARRLIAQKCLYGVDKNPFAVDLAKLSLWLATLAKSHPFTFLDHSLRLGDSLVGLSCRQITAFHWLPAQQQSFLEQELRKRIERVSQFRRRILAARDEVPYEQLRQQLDLAEEALFPLRRVGDVVIAAFFSADKPRDREQKRAELQASVEASFKHPGQPEYEDRIESALATSGATRIHPFHWELEFPELFDARLNSKAIGFDAVIGNPPFLSGRRISSVLGAYYFDFLSNQYSGAGNLCDLAAYFFRRAFQLLRDAGCSGLVATKTIAQGDTRTGGLAAILSAGGSIFSATRRLRWEGEAVVIVSVVHFSKGDLKTTKMLDGREVQMISAYLFHRGDSGQPIQLPYLKGLSSLGSKIYGQGFLFADGDDHCTPLSELQSILSAEPRCAERVLAYIGGEDVNTSPTQQTTRYAIYLSDIAEEQELRNWASLERIVRQKVKPERDKLGSNPNNIPLKKRWWAYQAHRPDFYAGLRRLKRVLVISRQTKHLSFTFLETGMIYSESLVLIALEDDASYAILQSRLHEAWARFLGSSLGDSLRYNSTDCFETFPFPINWQDKPPLHSIGRRYYEHRASVMAAKNEGLTTIYNRFNDPEESDAEVLKLRQLHDELDRSVFQAYGWNDLDPTYEFLLDYEEEVDAEPSRAIRKKPWHYRWPDVFRDEILARVLELNRERAKDEKLEGNDAGTPKPKKRALKSPTLNARLLFGADEVSE